MATTKVHLKFDPETVTFDQVIGIQEAASLPLREQKTMLAGFVVDADGKPLGQEEAEALLGKLTVIQMRETFTAFGAQMQTAMSETLPNEPGPQ